MKKHSLEKNLLLISLFLVTICLSCAYCAPVEESWLINCGSSGDSPDPSGNVWVKDEAYSSLYRWGYTEDDSHPASTTNQIIGTDLQAVYQTSRWGNMGYKIEVPNGTYKVTLMFAETNFNDPGQRVFNIAVQGATLWSDVDLLVLAGGKDKAMELTTNVTVNNSFIDITFPGDHVDCPTICGIKIEVVDVSNDAFLDFIEKKLFWFFWNETNPSTGLVKSIEDNWVQGYSNVSSIAVDGFALSIYTIGAERGWVSKEEAYQKVITMLNSFDTRLYNLHGFWYHFVTMDTCQRDGTSEVSTVDSALFILGALQAGEYFKNTNPPHTDVAAKAEELYRRMDWAWYTNVSDEDPFQNRFVNMGWKPDSDGSYYIASGRVEGGFFCNDWWNRYSESIFVDLLAFASPEHLIGLEAWNDMLTKWVVNIFGYDFINEPPLFTHQYHHLYFNLTDKQDSHTDYFLNTQKATLANRQTCLEDPQQRYEPKRWGLTACGGLPDGRYMSYGGLPEGYNDGTVAPCAATTSLMFTPDESMETVRYMFFKYKHMIWGLHGFCDSFNVQENFRNQMTAGLNNGAMLIGIENYRTGLVMNTFMNNIYANNAFVNAGLVPTPPIIESSYENSASRGANAYDNNMITRWSSQWSNSPQWLERDYKTPTTFNKVTISWEAAHAKSYKIQTSNNRINWTDIYSTASGDGGIDEIIFPNVSARYLRIYCTQRAAQWGYSIFEVNVENVPSYWNLNMSEMNWYQNAAPYNSTGAAVCQMILNYIRQGALQPLLSQEDIYRYAKNPDPYDGSDLTAIQVDKALGHFDPYDYLISNWSNSCDALIDGNPYKGYNYTVDSYDPGAMNEYIRDICHWMAYTVTKEDWWNKGELVARPNTPAAVPIYGSYAHWVVIKGYATDQNPAPDPLTNPWNTPSFTVYGFWMKDPLVTGIGQNVYVTASECESNYFMPLDTDDEYDGKLVQVAEPPAKPSTGRASILPPEPNPVNLEFVGIANDVNIDYTQVEQLAMSVSSSVSLAEQTQSIPLKQSWKDLVDKNLLLDNEAVAAFEGTRTGYPILVKRLDAGGSDYYLVPFNKKIGRRIFTSAMIILDASEGYFKEASWTKNPEELFKVHKAQAIELVKKKLLRSGDERTVQKIRYVEAELVWQPNSYSASPYRPFWKITIANQIWYVTMEGRIFSET